VAHLDDVTQTFVLRLPLEWLAVTTFLGWGINHTLCPRIFPKVGWQYACNANSASNVLNKRLHANFRKDIVINGFRHGMSDRLRAVSFPSEMIDQIGF
tara:strand:+ start:159 stop:452 length:294 start_codon:yes stop_codon:yes gene_type:complete